jgi:hypothetical protein
MSSRTKLKVFLIKRQSDTHRLEAFGSPYVPIFTAFFVIVNRLEHNESN